MDKIINLMGCNTSPKSISLEELRQVKLKVGDGFRVRTSRGVASCTVMEKGAMPLNRMAVLCQGWGADPYDHIELLTGFVHTGGWRISMPGIKPYSLIMADGVKLWLYGRSLQDVKAHAGKTLKIKREK